MKMPGKHNRNFILISSLVDFGVIDKLKQVRATDSWKMYFPDDSGTSKLKY